jgi:LPS-assembly protein
MPEFPGATSRARRPVPVARRFDECDSSLPGTNFFANRLMRAARRRSFAGLTFAGKWALYSKLSSGSTHYPRSGPNPPEGRRPAAFHRMPPPAKANRTPNEGRVIPRRLRPHPLPSRSGKILSRRRRRAFLSAILILLAAVPGIGGPIGGFDGPGPPWEIRAEVVEYDPEQRVYAARDGVTIVREDLRLSADRVLFHPDTRVAVAEGHVVLAAGGDILRGDRLTVNLDDRTGTLHDGELFFRESHFYIRGETIEKIGPESYRALRASLTACEGDRPDWKITARRVDVTVEGYGTLRHGALWARSLPVFYAPFFFFPVKSQRQTGLLTPSFGVSDRRGAEYAQPFFWALADRADATFYDHYMSDRGHRIGAEFRYLRDERSRGTLMAEYLRDRKIDDGTDEGARYGYADDGELRPNRDRYWIRGRFDQALPGDFRGRLDLDVIGDQDYLREFQGAYAGFDDSRDFFRSQFGREPEDFTDPVRTNRLSAVRFGTETSLHAEFLWHDDVIRRRLRDADDTLQQLPRIAFDRIKRSVAGTSLFWNLETEYTHFFRRDGARGHRVDLHPRLFWPRRLGSVLFAEPSVGFRETLWYVDRFDPDAGANPESDRFRHRESPDLRVDLFTELARAFPGDGRTRVHTVRPQLTYRYAPEQDQDDLPLFDPLDRIERRNRFTLSLVNALAGGADGGPLREFGRFELEQSFDFERFDPETDRLPFEAADRTRPEADRRLSPLYGRLELAPAPWLSVFGDAEWSHDASRFASRNIAAALSDRRGDRLFVEHRYTRDATESLYANLRATIAPAWLVFAEHERNLRASATLKTALGVRHLAGCWSLDLRYTRSEGNDTAVGFTINLNGLGGFGTN